MYKIQSGVYCIDAPFNFEGLLNFELVASPKFLHYFGDIPFWEPAQHSLERAVLFRIMAKEFRFSLMQVFYYAIVFNLRD